MQRTVATTAPDGGGMHAWRATLECAAGDRLLGGDHSGGCMPGALAWRGAHVADGTDGLASVGVNVLTVCPPADTLPLALWYASPCPAFPISPRTKRFPLIGRPEQAGTMLALSVGSTRPAGSADDLAYRDAHRAAVDAGAGVSTNAIAIVLPGLVRGRHQGQGGHQGGWRF